MLDEFDLYLTSLESLKEYFSYMKYHKYSSFYTSYVMRFDMLKNKCFENYFNSLKNKKSISMTSIGYIKIYKLSSDEIDIIEKTGSCYDSKKSKKIIDNLNYFEIIMAISKLQSIYAPFLKMKKELEHERLFALKKANSIDNASKTGGLMLSSKIVEERKLVLSQNADYYDIYIKLLSKKIFILEECLDLCNDKNNKLTLKSFSERLNYLLQEEDEDDNLIFDKDTIISWLKIKKNTFYDYKNGKCYPDLNKLKMLSLIFDVDIDYLLGLIDTERVKTSDDIALSNIGISEKAINNLNNLKLLTKDNIEKEINPHSIVIETINYLLEENDCSTLMSINEFLTQYINMKELIVTENDLFKLNLHITRLIDNPNASYDDFNNEFKEFTKALPENQFKSMELKYLNDIQDKLKKLKDTIINNANDQ